MDAEECLLVEALERLDLEDANESRRAWRYSILVAGGRGEENEENGESTFNVERPLPRCVALVTFTSQTVTCDRRD